MPFESKAQQRYLFAKEPTIAKRWAKETPDFKKLPEHKKKQTLKKTLKKFKGKGGLDTNPFAQASTPINLLKSGGTPPTAAPLPKTSANN